MKGCWTRCCDTLLQSFDFVPFCSLLCPEISLGDLGQVTLFSSSLPHKVLGRIKWGRKNYVQGMKLQEEG